MRASVLVVMFKMDYKVVISHLGNDPQTNEPNFEWNIWSVEPVYGKHISLIAKVRSFEAMQQVTKLLNDTNVIYLNIDVAR